MKNAFTKKMLLMVAVAIAWPVHAMDYTKSLIQSASNKAHALSAGMSREELINKLNHGVHNAVDKLHNLAKCAKSEKGCSRLQIAAIGAAVTLATGAAIALTAVGKRAYDKKNMAKIAAQKKADIAAAPTAEKLFGNTPPVTDEDFFSSLSEQQ